MRISDYDVSRYADGNNQFYIGDVYEVLAGIAGLRDKILKSINLERLGYNFLEINNQGSYISSFKVHEKGMVFEISNVIPCDANKYEDFVSTRLYLFDNGEVHYILSSLDNRIDRGFKIDEETISKLDSMLGSEIKLLDESSKLSRFFNKNKNIEIGRIITRKIDSLLNMVDDEIIQENNKGSRGR